MKFAKIVLYAIILLGTINVYTEFSELELQLPEIDSLQEISLQEIEQMQEEQIQEIEEDIDPTIYRKNFIDNNEDQLPIVVIICSYNNAKWAVRNLSSVFSQRYKNFRVIYVDDASTDDTVKVVQEYINKYNLQNKFTLIQNSFRGRKLKNMFKSYRTCEDNEIIIQLDGDDWFAHQNVLSFINIQFKKDTWLTYGTHKNYPPSSANIGAKSRPTPSLTIQNRTFRNDFLYMPLRTFYAWLFKQIKLEDMIASHSYDNPQFRGKFYPASNDAVIMWAMLEMAHKKFKYVPQILYIANRGNPIIGLKVDRALQEATAKDIRKVIPLYPAIQKPLALDKNILKSLQATGIIFAFNSNLDSLEKVIEATKNYIKNMNHLVVLYHEKKSTKYQKLQNKYPNVRFINIAQMDFARFINTLKAIPNSYFLLLNDTTTIDRPLPCNFCIQELEKTAAYAFYYALSDKLMAAKKIPYEHIFDNLYVWKFGCDDKKQIPIHNFNATLLRKKTMLAELKQINQPTAKKLLQEWLTSSISPKRVGLFFGTYTN